MGRRLLPYFLVPLVSLWLATEYRTWVFDQSLQTIPSRQLRKTERLRQLQRFSSPADVATSSVVDGFPVSTAFWTWQGEKIHYYAAGPLDGQPVLLIHGFGVSGLNFRGNFAALASEGYRVYALDLLGFGLSSKPVDRTYSLELWETQTMDFCQCMGGAEQPWVLGGNSIGGIIAMGVASKSCSGAEEKSFGGVRGLLLFNCAAGSNNKLVLTSYRTNWLEKTLGWIVFSLFDVVLAQEAIARFGFEQLATKGTVKALLQNVYVNSERVNDELVDNILTAAADENALSVLVKCLSGDPGTPPEKLVSKVSCPVKMIWGDKDSLTPLGVGYGFFFRALAKLYPSRWSLSVVPAGHCPHDDAPDAVHAVLMPWLASLTEEATKALREDVDLDQVFQLSFDADALERFDGIRSGVRTPKQS